MENVTFVGGGINPESRASKFSTHIGSLCESLLGNVALKHVLAYDEEKCLIHNGLFPF